MAGIRLVGGKFDGQSTLWDGRMRFSIKRAQRREGIQDFRDGFAAVGSQPSAATITYDFEMYRARVIHVDGQQVDYAAPEHWTDLQAIRHLLRTDL